MLLKNVLGKLNKLQTNQPATKNVHAGIDGCIFRQKILFDANNTMRVTYDKVNGYEARDADKYDYYTYLDGVMEKYIPDDYDLICPKN